MIDESPTGTSRIVRPTSSIPAHRQAVMFPVSGELRTVNSFGRKDGGPRRDACRIHRENSAEAKLRSAEKIFRRDWGTLGDRLIKGGRRSRWTAASVCPFDGRRTHGTLEAYAGYGRGSGGAGTGLGTAPPYRRSRLGEISHAGPRGRRSKSGQSVSRKTSSAYADCQSRKLDRRCSPDDLTKRSTSGIPGSYR